MLANQRPYGSALVGAALTPIVAPTPAPKPKIELGIRIFCGTLWLWLLPPSSLPRPPPPRPRPRPRPNKGPLMRLNLRVARLSPAAGPDVAAELEDDVEAGVLSLVDCNGKFTSPLDSDADAAAATSCRCT